MSSPNVLKINEELKEACSTCFCTFQHFVIRYAKTTFSFYQEFVLLCSDLSHRSSDASMCLSEVILLVGNEFILNVTFRLKALSLQHMERRMVLIKFYIWDFGVGWD